LSVNLSTGALTWNSTPGFLTTGTLNLNSTTALFDVDFQNAIDLNAGTRTVQVFDNASTNMDFATLSGVISGTGASNLVLNAGAPLYVKGANTYAGTTTLSGAAAVAVTSIGASGATATNFGTNVGGGALNLGNGTTTGGYLLYYGAGETVTRPVNINVTTTGAPTIDSSGSGPLIFGTITNNLAGAKTLNLRGFNTDPNEVTGNLADNGALGITKSDAGVWILSGNNNITGTVSINGGTLMVRGLTSGTAGTNLGTGTVSFSNANLAALNPGGFTMSNPVSIASNTVAGFTEHDTFRSNQIREGDLTREEALQLAEDENQPRYPNIKWYLDAIGFDFKSTIEVINRIPKLYEQ
jgi:autotransporter-associated beta strand protein